MADYLNVYDLDRQKSAVLQNAFEITETQELNKIYTLDFKIPADDVKVQFLQPFHYVRYGDTGELYRIIKTELEDSDTPILSVNCEHVIATLCDDLMFGSLQVGGKGIPTNRVIAYLLSQQKTQNWELDECDFSRQFQYLFEQETILNALYSIPKEFTKAYKWTFDTSGYRWKLSLKAIDASIHPEYYIRAKRNLLSSGTAQDFTGVCTRIYPLGYGEGVNQLSIKDATVDKNSVVKVIRNGKTIAINGEISTADDAIKYGNSYIEASSEIVAQYGIKEKVLVDRRFEDTNSLFSYAQTMLDGLTTPSMSRSFNVIDLYPLTSQDIDNAEVGKICKMTGDGTIAYITKTRRVLDDAGNLQIELSTKATDVASAVADLADRVRIESVYAQGATQLYQHSKDANASTTKGMVMSLYFPSEMRQINKVLMRLKLGKFRAYSQASSGQDGGINKNTGENGAINQNTDDGGAINQKTDDGGAIDIESGAGGAQEGQTGVASGGGGISLSGVSVDITGLTIEVANTGQADWVNKPNDLGVSTSLIKYNNAEFETESSLMIENKNHTHPINSSGYVSYATPLESADYRHTHYLSSGDEPNVNLSSGDPSNWFPYITDSDGHKHSISKADIQHTHSASLTGSASGTVNIVNNEGNGQTGFSHSHSFKIGDHKHPIVVGAHKHPIVVGDHSHSIVVDPHSHSIEPGIYEFGEPSGYYVYVNRNKLTNFVSVVNGKNFRCNEDGKMPFTSFDGDIVSWLLNDKNLIPRDTWIDVEIRPDDLAYIQCSVFVQGLVQSRGSGNY